MLWLPVPAVAASGPIAVADSSAAAIECAVLETDVATSAVHLRTAMLADPWLCQWMAAWPDADVASLDTLAKWFAGDLVARLASLPAEPPAWTRPAPSDQQQYAEQAAAILARAYRRTGAGVDVASSGNFIAAVLEPGDLPSEATVAGAYLTTHAGVEWRLPRVSKRLVQDCGGGDEFAQDLEQAKLDAMKELAYGASHEVNNPLANISGRAQSLLRDETEPMKRRLLSAIDAQAMRAHEMISDLMLFARPPALEKQQTDIVVLVEEMLDELRAPADSRKVELQRSGLESLFAVVDPTQLAVAVKAVVQNGIDAVGSDGHVTTSVETQNGQAVIEVADTGPGIADDVRQHMFDPFYSGREAGRGLGFGLSKCWRIVTEHGGTVAVTETSIAGTTITMRLPLGEEG